jgi:hypothetical protein
VQSGAPTGLEVAGEVSGFTACVLDDAAVDSDVLAEAAVVVAVGALAVVAVVMM